MVHVQDVVQAAVLAGTHPEAVGQAYSTREMGGGRWEMGDGGLRTEDGGRRTEDGGLKTED